MNSPLGSFLLPTGFDGPAGIRGLNIVDVPFNAKELQVDLAAPGAGSLAWPVPVGTQMSRSHASVG